MSGMASAYLKKVVVSCVLPTCGLVSSGGPTATLGTCVSQLPALGSGTAFQLVLCKCTLATNSLNGCCKLICLSVEIVTICLNCASPNFLSATSLLTYCADLNDLGV